MEYLIELGKNIRKIRKSQGFSQEEFAKYCYLGRSYYGRIERGEVNLSVTKLLLICIKLNIKISDISPEE